MLDPARHAAANSKPTFVCGEEPSVKCDFKNVFSQLAMFDKDRRTAEFITF